MNTATFKAIDVKQVLQVVKHLVQEGVFFFTEDKIVFRTLDSESICAIYFELQPFKYLYTEPIEIGISITHLYKFFRGTNKTDDVVFNAYKDKLEMTISNDTGFQSTNTVFHVIDVPRHMFPIPRHAFTHIAQVKTQTIQNILRNTAHLSPVMEIGVEDDMLCLISKDGETITSKTKVSPVHTDKEQPMIWSRFHEEIKGFVNPIYSKYIQRVFQRDASKVVNVYLKEEASVGFEYKSENFILFVLVATIKSPSESG